ncbi:MAG: hypothetical protein LBV67_06990 [Streptococcaceae bacterium]|jgi:hypothetical protein|nr:hypothetical protein [Streptococcaceae bacterium]
MNKTVPIFHCIYDIEQQLEFYTALGFKTTYLQKAPYKFATVENEFTEINFFGNKNFHPEYSPSGAYAYVENIEQLHTRLKANLKSHYGKIPVKGLPRISRLNKTVEDRRFLITDLSGNSIIVGEPLKEL